jgi:hypothetical protein
MTFHFVSWARSGNTVCFDHGTVTPTTNYKMVLQLLILSVHGLVCDLSLSYHYQFHHDKNTETANPKSIYKKNARKLHLWAESTRWRAFQWDWYFKTMNTAHWDDSKVGLLVLFYNDHRVAFNQNDHSTFLPEYSTMQLQDVNRFCFRILYFKIWKSSTII